MVPSRGYASDAVTGAPDPSSVVAPAMVWINGERQPDGGAHVSARDRGLTLADGVFETMLVRGGTVFRLRRHLARLERGLAALEIATPPDLDDWVLGAIRAAVGRDASIRLTSTRGVGPAGVSPPAGARPTVIITMSPMPSFPASIYDEGLTAHVASGRRNERAMTAGLKTLAYTDAIAGLLEARRAGADEALFLDTDGHCSEATASNLFAWTGEVLVTPPLSCGVLPGVTREAVLELAHAQGLPAEERAFGLEELLTAEEAFLTSSLRGLAPLVRVGPQAIGRGTPGQCTRRLTAAYLALVDQECGA
jgi:branched-chain amino acid aminotransferase